MSKIEQRARRHYLSPRPSVLITFCLVLLGLLIGPPDSMRAQDQSKKLNPYTGNKETIAEGEQLYKMLNCYGCHGMRGGGGMGPNLTDETWMTGDGSDASLLTQIMEGRGNMPAYKGAIDEDQAWKMIAFIRTLYKGDPTTVK